MDDLPDDLTGDLMDDLTGYLRGNRTDGQTSDLTADQTGGVKTYLTGVLESAPTGDPALSGEPRLPKALTVQAYKAWWWPFDFQGLDASSTRSVISTSWVVRSSLVYSGE